MIKGSGVRGVLFAAVFVGIVAIAGAAAFVQPRSGEVHGPFLTGSGYQDIRIITDNASQYLPNGYREVQVSLSSMKNNTEIVLGSVTFTYYVPSTNPRPGVEVDYLCDSFFAARLPNGSQFLLDYCSPYGGAQRSATMTTTVQTGNTTGIEMYNVGTPWSEWELSRGTTPTVGVHVQGTGNNITYVGLVVGG